MAIERCCRPQERRYVYNTTQVQESALQSQCELGTCLMPIATEYGLHFVFPLFGSSHLQLASYQTETANPLRSTECFEETDRALSNVHFMSSPVEYCTAAIYSTLPCGGDGTL